MSVCGFVDEACEERLDVIAGVEACGIHDLVRVSDVKPWLGVGEEMAMLMTVGQLLG